VAYFFFGGGHPVGNTVRNQKLYSVSVCHITTGLLYSEDPISRGVLLKKTWCVCQSLCQLHAAQQTRGTWQNEFIDNIKLALSSATLSAADVSGENIRHISWTRGRAGRYDSSCADSTYRASARVSDHTACQSVRHWQTAGCQRPRYLSAIPPNRTV